VRSAFRLHLRSPVPKLFPPTLLGTTIPHMTRLTLSLLVALSFTSSLVTEGKHQCAQLAGADPHTAHQQHDPSPTGTPETGRCDCLGHCCSATIFAWDTPSDTLTLPDSYRIERRLGLTSQHVLAPLRYRLPLAQAPPFLTTRVL